MKIEKIKPIPKYIQKKIKLYLIAHAGGLMVVPQNLVPEYKKMLVKYYEGTDEETIKSFMREKCLKTF